MQSRVAFLSLALPVVVAACGGAQPAAPAAPSAPAASASAAPAVAAPGAWKDAKSKDEKVAFMKTKVAPHMAEVFRAADATRYAKFDCKTCHGPAYKEPKEFLPHLVMKDGKITAFAEKPEVAKFMAEKVVPEMAAIFGEKPYDPATKTGFGCMECHAIDMK